MNRTIDGTWQPRDRFAAEGFEDLLDYINLFKKCQADSEGGEERTLEMLAFFLPTMTGSVTLKPLQCGFPVGYR